MKLGITGGIGSGKTTVVNMFLQKGALVYHSDLRAKELIATLPQIRQDIIKIFGEQAYLGDVYNAKFIASIVFNNKYLLNCLNNITHPAVLEDFKSFCKLHPHNTIVYESALMIETGHYQIFDRVILVTAPLDIKIERILKRDASTVELVKKRIENQMSDDIKKRYANFIIENINLLDTQHQVDKIWNDLGL